MRGFLGHRAATSESYSIFRLVVPENAVPGQEVQVVAGSRMMRVRYPPDVTPGQCLQIKIPHDGNAPAPVHGSSNSVAASPSAPRATSDASLSTDSPNVRVIDDPNARGGTPAYMVSIPEGIHEGESFQITIRGQRLMVTCPPNVRAGMSVRINPPLPPGDLPRRRTTDSSTEQNDQTQLFEVVVPPGVQPGQPFSLRAKGVRVLVTCPPTASPGQRIRFKLPIAITEKHNGSNDFVNIKLSYDKDGWQRTIRASDMKFQWVRVDDKGEVETNTRFHITKSAYVRKLEFIKDADARLRRARLSLVPATEAVVDSHVRGPNKNDVVTYSDIARAQVKTFDEKVTWFQSKCDQLSTEWNAGHMRIAIRREYLLADSMVSIMSMRRKDLRKKWRFVFINEPGIDAGGLSKEWFQLVFEQILNPALGLWQSSAGNQMCLEINPACELLFNDHLTYFRFLGRIMGKALFDRRLVAGHMVQYIYKHLLGWPITFSDLQLVDEEIFHHLKSLDTMHKNGDDLEMLCLDFTVTQDIVGTKKVIDLVDGGANIEVTNDNFPEFLEASLKYRMLDRVKPQLSELLLGFFDVIPEPLLTVFDFQELELLMCGVPTIDMKDWMENTDYSGEYGFIGVEHPVCTWFWEIVSEFDLEMKARLLQFVTGTSGVPGQGFGVLQGNDGNIRKFTLHGVSLAACFYPRAHTCFNRLDLPLCESKGELQEKLKLAVTMASTGFDIE